MIKTKHFYKLLLLGLLLLSGIYAYTHRSNFSANSKNKPIAVSAATALHKNVTAVLDSTGQVQSISTVSVTPQVSGQLDKVDFKEGDTVTQGQILFEIDARPFQTALAQAKAQLARDQAQFLNAHAALNRGAALRKKGFLSQQDYDQLKSNDGSLAAAISADEAAVQQAEHNLAYCTIKSPVTGRTGSLLVMPGNIVSPNTSVLVTVKQIQPIDISFTLPEKALSSIQWEQQQDAVTVTANNANHSKNFYGKLSFIDNAIDSATGTIQLKARFDNKDEQLWPGQFVTVHIPFKNFTQALIIPVEAVQQGQEGAYVYVVNDNHTISYRPIVTGLQVAEGISVESGLKAGEKVVTAGQLKLTDGSRVNVIKP